MSLQPRLLQHADCLSEMLDEGIKALVKHEDLYDPGAQFAVLKFCWDLIAAMPQFKDRVYWIDRVATLIYIRFPSMHLDYIRHAVKNGVQKIRQAEGLPL